MHTSQRDRLYSQGQGWRNCAKLLGDYIRTYPDIRLRIRISEVRIYPDIRTKIFRIRIRISEVRISGYPRIQFLSDTPYFKGYCLLPLQLQWLL